MKQEEKGIKERLTKKSAGDFFNLQDRVTEMIVLVTKLQTNPKENIPTFDKVKCKLTEAEFNHKKQLFNFNSGIKEFEAKSEQLKKKEKVTPEERKQLIESLPYKNAPIDKVKQWMKESDLDPDNFIKPLEDDVSHEIVLKLDDLKWINFYKKMKNHQFPKEITVY